jgi:FkbM family methyltransferase
MKYIFIDGGARVGESIEYLLDKRPELIGSDVYMFECNPAHFETLHNLKEINKNYNFIIKEYALWIENTTKMFFISVDRWGDLGCTLKPEKKEKLDLERPLFVNCIDITEFINTLNENDYIILKLDVEGAEYDILEYMIANGSIHKIKELYIEFHDGFFNEDSTHLKNKLSQFNIKCDFNWI